MAPTRFDGSWLVRFTAPTGVGIGLLILLSVAPTVAASTAVSDLALVELLSRLQRLLRNVVYLLGPILLLAGLVLYFLSGRRTPTSNRGHRLIVGGSVLFGIAIAVDLLLELIAWIATNGRA